MSGFHCVCVGLGLTGDLVRNHVACVLESSPRDSKLGTCLKNPTPHWLKVARDVNTLHPPDSPYTEQNK